MTEKWIELWADFQRDATKEEKCDKCSSPEVVYSIQALKYDKDEDTGDEVSEYVDSSLCQDCYEASKVEDTR